MSKKNKKGADENVVPVEGAEGAVVEQVEKVEKPEKEMTLEEQIESLKKKLAKAKGEYKAPAGVKKEKVEPPQPPTSVEITSRHFLDESIGFVVVETNFGHIKYTSYPKDFGKGIARTVVTIGEEQIHKFNNIGIANVVSAEVEKFNDPSEMDAIIFHALKSRREEIHAVPEELYSQATAIRAEKRAKETEEREKTKQENVAKKAAAIQTLEEQLKELEAKIGM